MIKNLIYSIIGYILVFSVTWSDLNTFFSRVSIERATRIAKKFVLEIKFSRSIRNSKVYSMSRGEGGQIISAAILFRVYIFLRTTSKIRTFSENKRFVTALHFG